MLVLPFKPIGFRDRGCFCDAVTLNLMRALAAGGQARVVPWTTARWLVEKTGDKHEYYQITGVDAILEGLVEETAGNRKRVTVQWIDGPTALCDSFYEARGGLRDDLDLASDLAIRLARRLCIIYDERSRLQLTLRHSRDLAAATFYLKAREGALSMTPHGVRRALALLDHSLKRDPYFAAAHALLAETHLAVADSGIAPATRHAPLARDAAHAALSLAPELGDALAARGAVELTYDWDFRRAEETLRLAGADALAESAPHWPPILEVSRGNLEKGASAFESWARLDPGSAGKAMLACEMWYYARQFDLAVHWGLRALELDPANIRATVLLSTTYMEAGKREESLRIGRGLCEAAPDLCEPYLVLVGLLAQAGRRADALAVMQLWNRRKGNRYEPPFFRATANTWLGEPAAALDALREVVKGRQTACLFARFAPYFAPLRHLPEFDRILSEAGLPEPVKDTPDLD
ncbi:MAG TPA: hypothetical protein VME43_08710 [Bryobacteraceae bacterium]|nr:hypothetical protein [Bryobacteraceae bacterium]